ncbi:MAG: flagellar basal body L-ring protein FlgH [Pseudomonadota bacterium]
MKPLAYAILAAMLILTAGCAGDPALIQADKPVMPPPDPARNLQLAKPSYGSMYTDRTQDFYQDLRARNVGDIIVVEIVENSKAKKKNDTKAERTNEVEATIPYLMGYAGGLRREADSKNTDPLIGAGFKSKHDAKSELKKEDSMTSSIGCTVIEKMINGNLVVRGSRELQVNGETQYIVLQGIVRPTDVTATNTVYSTQLADARIYYTGRGVLSDKQKPGWLARLLDNIWPF